MVSKFKQNFIFIYNTIMTTIMIKKKNKDNIILVNNMYAYFVLVLTDNM